MLLANIRYLVTQDASRRVLEHVSVRIDGERIAQIGELHPSDGETVIDCSRKAVLPGLINAHTHLGMAELRGICDDEDLHAWLERIFAKERQFTPDSIECASESGMRECLRMGTTTVVDMFYHVGAIAKAAHRTGIRAILGQTYLHGHPLSAGDLGLPKDDGAVSFAHAPHAIYTTDEALLRAIRADATRHRRRILMHLSETRQERAQWKAKTGVLPVEWLERIGFLSPDVAVVHCVWLTKGELDILARHGVALVHCPQSNMKLAGGSVMPLREMRERGMRVCLGTDSVASNNSLDMFREMHMCALLHKHHYWDPTVTKAQDVLDMATVGAAAALDLKDLGSVETGKLADLVALDLDDLNLQPHGAHSIVSHIVYAAQGLNVSEVIVDGQIVLRDKRFVEAHP